MIAAAIIQRAAELRAARRKDEFEALASMIGNRVGEVVARMFSK